MAILCPTRGGQASYPTQDRAIALAKERGQPLYFLYVSDVRFLGNTAAPVVVDLEEEMGELGEFLLAMAEERAEKAGVRAKGLVRRGTFRKAVAEVIEEHDIQTVVLGSPGESTRITTEAYLEELTSWLVENYGVEVIVVKEGEIVRHARP